MLRTLRWPTVVGSLCVVVLGAGIAIASTADDEAEVTTGGAALTEAATSVEDAPPTTRGSEAADAGSTTTVETTTSSTTTAAPAPPTSAPAPVATVPPTQAPPSAPPTTAPATTAPVIMNPPSSPPIVPLVSVPPPTTLTRECESAMVAWVNDARAQRGLPALATNGRLATMSRSWSMQMATQGRLYHHPNAIPELLTMGRAARENVGQSTLSARSIFDKFMDSDHHRANILATNVDQIGVGCVHVGGAFWVTQKFLG